MKRVLLARPGGALLYELSDEEYARLDHLLSLAEPRARGSWVARFLAERVPVTIYPPEKIGLPDDIEIDRAIGGNYFTPKWGRFLPPAD